MLLDAFPQQKQGAAMTVFGLAARLAPVIRERGRFLLSDGHSAKEFDDEPPPCRRARAGGMVPDGAA